MSDPKSWIDEPPERLLEQLVSAARNEEPAPGALARTLSGVGLATAAASTATTAGAASGTAASAAGSAAAAKLSAVGAASVLKWTLVAAAVAGSAGIAIETVEQRTAVPTMVPSSRPAVLQPMSQPAAPAVLVAPIAPVVEAEPTPKPAPKAARNPAAGRAEPVVESPPSASAERLAEEVRSIDEARVRVSSGRAAEALATLDAYDRSFDKPGFAPEALYLRMEALKQLGRNAAAQSVAARLVQSYPNSPQAPRARQILAEQNP